MSEQVETQAPQALDHLGVLKNAPHRYPFLMVDRILEVSDDATEIVGIKNVTFNEPFFQGHFPGQPIMPGVLQIEAMAQVGGLCVNQSDETAGLIGVLVSVDGAKFKRAVVPGDQLRISAKILRNRRGLVEIEAKCTVDGELASQAKIKFMMAPKSLQQ